MGQKRTYPSKGIGCGHDISSLERSPRGVPPTGGALHICTRYSYTEKFWCHAARDQLQPGPLSRQDRHQHGTNLLVSLMVSILVKRYLIDKYQRVNCSVRCRHGHQYFCNCPLKSGLQRAFVRERRLPRPPPVSTRLAIDHPGSMAILWLSSLLRDRLRRHRLIGIGVGDGDRARPGSRHDFEPRIEVDHRRGELGKHADVAVRLGGSVGELGL